MSQVPWFEANPVLLQREVDDLTAVGVAFTLDETALGWGILKIDLVIEPTNPAFELTGRAEALRLEAIFPDNYPYFRPEVRGLNVDLPRHQDPIGKNLCLLPRPTKNWNPEWTLAAYLQSQLSIVLAQGVILDPEQLAANPAEQAEPVSNYYGGAQHPVIFDSLGFDALPPPVEAIAVVGRLEIGFPRKAAASSRMAVLEGVAMDGQVMGRLPESFQELFPHRCTGFVLRLSERPPFGDAAKDAQRLLSLLQQQRGGLMLRSRLLVLKDGFTVTHVWGLNFPEEVSPGKLGMGWVFLIQGIQQVRLPAKGKGKGKVSKRAQPVAYYAQVARSGTQDLQIRVPTLTGLPQHAIAMVGLGALGAPAAIEFARNQVGALRLLDYDVVEPATAVRWPLGLPAFGQRKTTALQEFLAAHYPRTRVMPFHHKIGGIRRVGGADESEQQVLDQLLDGISLLFDASAELGVSQFLAEEAKKRNIPFVSIYATPGAWGGLVMRVVPGKTAGCWMCLQHAKDDTIPTPRSNAAGEIQAPGCGDLTFTGASFDLQNIVLAGVRLAIATICAGAPDAYSEVSWDVGVLNLVDENHRPVPPSWQIFPLERHPNCPYCSGP